MTLNILTAQESPIKRHKSIKKFSSNNKISKFNSSPSYRSPQSNNQHRNYHNNSARFRGSPVTRSRGSPRPRASSILSFKSSPARISKMTPITKKLFAVGYGDTASSVSASSASATDRHSNHHKISTPEKSIDPVSLLSSVPSMLPNLASMPVFDDSPRHQRNSFNFSSVMQSSPIFHGYYSQSTPGSASTKRSINRMFSVGPIESSGSVAAVNNTLKINPAIDSDDDDDDDEGLNRNSMAPLLPPVTISNLEFSSSDEDEDVFIDKRMSIKPPSMPQPSVGMCITTDESGRAVLVFNKPEPNLMYDIYSPKSEFSENMMHEEISSDWLNKMSSDLPLHTDRTSDFGDEYNVFLKPANRTPIRDFSGHEASDELGKPFNDDNDYDKEEEVVDAREALMRSLAV